jgi:hypothetical protein
MLSTLVALAYAFSAVLKSTILATVLPLVWNLLLFYVHITTLREFTSRRTGTGMLPLVTSRMHA